MILIDEKTEKKVNLDEEVQNVIDLVKNLWNGDQQLIEKLVYDAFYEGFNKNSCRVFDYPLNQFFNKEKKINDFNYLDLNNKFFDLRTILFNEFNKNDLEKSLESKYPYLKELKFKELHPKNFKEAKKLLESYNQEQLNKVSEDTKKLFNGHSYIHDVSLPERINAVDIMYDKSEGVNPIMGLFISIYSHGVMISKHFNTFELVEEIKNSDSTTKNFNNKFLQMIPLLDEEGGKEKIIDLFNQKTNKTNARRLK